MSKGQRWSERWFRLGLWLIALAFAWFLIGLGDALVGDLPKVERRLHLDDFIDQEAAAPLRATLEKSRDTAREAEQALEQSQVELQIADQAYSTASQSFQNWLATRQATQRPDQDREVVERTKGLDVLQSKQQALQAGVENQHRILLEARQTLNAAESELGKVEGKAQQAMVHAQKIAELRVFLYRLAATLPLLIIAGWLFVRRRNGNYWPFTWGFILFALFSFFFELVPYLPNYGGYIRYSMGIIITVFLGRYAIVALNRYLLRQRELETLPDAQRHQDIDYDKALGYLSKSLCPGCERKVNMGDGITDFCPHCGISLFCRCPICQTRRNTFAHFCHACGASSTEIPTKTTLTKTE